ncbi:F0F1 ATP synthase subunit delta [Helicobacter pametensis]|uniref:F0F1 ATP synthase subunit delta n=1 Tax=Helicobacter pametensis TaxID=95149 RepID=UPI00048696B3|nr:F0F1 ATP synthase subunit delta [Helicobacter pametensis]
MRRGLARKYAKILKESFDSKVLLDLVDQKPLIQECFQNSEFQKILSNPFILALTKVGFVDSCLDFSHQGMREFVRMMADSQTLHLLLEVVEELESSLRLDQKQCCAILSSSDKLDQNLIELFKKQLEEKTGYQIMVKEASWNKEEVGCYIEELDLEVSFSKEKFDRDLKNFILVSFMQGVQIEE